MARADIQRVVAPGDSSACTLGIGGAPTTVLLADGAQFDLTGGEVLLVRNPTGGSITFTVQGPADALGRTGNRTQIVTAGNRAVAGPFRAGTIGWKQSADGKVYIDVTADGLEMTVFAT